MSSFFSCFLDGRRATPTPGGHGTSVRESRLRHNRQQLRHGAAPGRGHHRHSGSTAPAQEVLGLARATSVHGAAQGGMPQLPHVGRGCCIAAQRRGERSRHFVITSSGAISAGITTKCSSGASQGGCDCAVALSLRDALQCCDLRIISQHQHERVRGAAGSPPPRDPQAHHVIP